MEKEILTELAEPFNPSEVSLKVQATNRDKSKGMVVAYVDARTVLDRLDEVVGPEGWHDTYEVLADRNTEGGRLVEVKCRLTVMGITKEDVGEGDSLKAAFSDALKRAAVKFGVGRYLYSLPKVWADLDERGNIKDPDGVKAKLLGQSGPLKEAPVQVADDDTPPWEDPKGGSRDQGGEDNLISQKQKQMIWVLMKKLDDNFSKQSKEEQAEDIRMMAEAALGREVEDPSRLTKAEASKLIDYLQKLAKSF